MSQAPSKRELREKLGFESDAELARYFEISTSAVAQWDEDGPVPRLRWLEFQTRQVGAAQPAPGASGAAEAA